MGLSVSRLRAICDWYGFKMIYYVYRFPEGILVGPAINLYG
ncbi:hypothetical protein [Pyrobaculum aerophilum]|uniref:Conserved within P. aerophilum n=1 Tax=Pyrobaculum aerophilum (strain ATCC 51768 / DSM 7523 / JCM 9630 / CIP 104966 / NBRC 100827 / IM2) TaxID=178306 RepID=Q8ZSQ7_PYRAE|nr:MULTISPECIES: hypothetical protein [Pyrobaculum]AAL65056.1 conserved within P. aerophilum [Pyrobaculum aerophilum str. IM2]MCX8137653.1 hypothetical protein [Pyrobaculum aerophilum]